MELLTEFARLAASIAMNMALLTEGEALLTEGESLNCRAYAELTCLNAQSHL